ncbi:MAG: sigma-54 factor interaction domain-containing protein, partial [Nanoarchaeota archaeon]|nr:sigma-54 factor interaction domain-containing protein [Nanoarchaeota archaeon]
GCRKGAFTGADDDRIGILEIINTGGVLILDEVTEANDQVQVKLLRALENNEFMPIGAGQACTSKVHFIGVTNRNQEDIFHLTSCFYKRFFYGWANLIQVQIH